MASSTTAEQPTASSTTSEQQQGATANTTPVVQRLNTGTNQGAARLRPKVLRAIFPEQEGTRKDEKMRAVLCFGCLAKRSLKRAESDVHTMGSVTDVRPPPQHSTPRRVLNSSLIYSLLNLTIRLSPPASISRLIATQPLSTMQNRMRISGLMNKSGDASCSICLENYGTCVLIVPLPVLCLETSSPTTRSLLLSKQPKPNQRTIPFLILFSFAHLFFDKQTHFV
jgi:hypothetical protein